VLISPTSYIYRYLRAAPIHRGGGVGSRNYLDLPLHGDAEERDEVHDEDGPEDGDVEELKEGADERDDSGLRC